MRTYRTTFDQEHAVHVSDARRAALVAEDFHADGKPNLVARAAIICGESTHRAHNCVRVMLHPLLNGVYVDAYGRLVRR